MTWPTPWLLPEEMERFIIPLRELIPWKPFTPKWLYANMKNPPINLKDIVGNGLIYVGRYYFPTPEGGQKFFESVKQIAREEKVIENNIYVCVESDLLAVA